MSASREKKQRQNAGPSDKALKAQQEQAARKRKTVIYSVIAGVVAVAVAALLIWNSGFFQARSTAATLGDTKLTVAELSYYYYDARSYYAMYGSYLGFDTSKSDDAQVYNQGTGETYRDFFLQTALDNARQDLALSNEAQKANHTQAEVKESVDAAISSLKSAASSNGYSYDAYLKAIYGPYMSADVYERMYTRALLASLARTEKSAELYNGYTQEELDAYYQEHADTLDTIEFSHLYFPAAAVDTKDADGNDLPEGEVDRLKEEALAEAKEQAEKALLAVKGGSTFQSQVDKYELTTGGDHVTVVGTSSINSSFRDQLLALDKDSVEMVETDSGYYVISLHNRYLSNEPTRDVRHILARAENTTDSDNKLVPPTDEAWAAAKAKMDEIRAAWDASDGSEDAFAKLANEKSDDGNGTTGGLYERNSEGYFVPEFNDWVFDSSRQPGEVDMVQHVAAEGASSGYYGYHLIYYVGENEPVWKGTARNTLASTALTEWLDTLVQGYAANLEGGADNLGR